jgi:hypothetical protein
VLKVLESKAGRIDLELRADPTRSDREIGRICGVDHKTVAARRAKIPQSGEMGNSDSPLGGLFAQEDSPLDENSPEDSPPAEIEAQNSPPDSALEPDPALNAANEDDPDPHVLAGQHQIEIYFNKDGGLVLKQLNWPDEDSFIIVAAPYKGTFLDKLCDVLGVM